MTDRPPTILSPYGEGYCRYCRFVVGLGADGLMDYHERGQNFPQACTGGGHAPAKITPYASGKNMFHSKQVKATCPRCQQQVILLRGEVIDRHNHRGILCAAAYLPYTPQP